MPSGRHTRTSASPFLSSCICTLWIHLRARYWRHSVKIKCMLVNSVPQGIGCVYNAKKCFPPKFSTLNESENGRIWPIASGRKHLRTSLPTLCCARRGCNCPPTWPWATGPQNQLFASLHAQPSAVCNARCWISNAFHFGELNLGQVEESTVLVHEKGRKKS